MITKLLLILFFVVLAIKPTYWMTEIEDDEGHDGSIVACSALFYVIYLRIKFGNAILILSGKDYEKVIEFYNEHC